MNGLRTATANSMQCSLNATNKERRSKLWQLSFGFVRPIGTSRTF